MVSERTINGTIDDPLTTSIVGNMHSDALKQTGAARPLLDVSTIANA